MFARHSTALLILTLLVVAFVLATARPSRGAGAEVRYVVHSGDTLWAIASKRYAGDPREAVWRIAERNGLGSGALQPGTVLYLPQ
jgi:nucleoid-associated protein YgaU